MNYKVETVTLKSLAKLQAERNRNKYSNKPQPIAKQNTLMKFGDGDGSFMDRWLTNTVPSVSSYKDGWIKPVSGFKAEKQQMMDASIKRGQEIRAIRTTTKAERQMFGRPFESDSSCSDSDSDSDWWDEENELEAKEEQEYEKNKFLRRMSVKMNVDIHVLRKQLEATAKKEQDAQQTE